MLFLSIHPLQAVLWKEACPPRLLPWWHQVSATGSVIDTASPRLDETPGRGNFVSSNTAPAAAASEQRRCSRAPPGAWQSCRQDERFPRSSCVPWAGGRAEHRCRHHGPPPESPGTGLRARRERRAGAMEAAADSTRFGYILELLKRDKVGTESGAGPPGHRGAGAGRDGSRRNRFAGLF